MAKVVLEFIQKLTGKGPEEAEKGLQDLKSTVTNVTAGLVAMGATFKQAFDLAEEGAALNQLEESFNRMNTAVFKTPDLLNRMSEAARGTIKETDLMAGLLKLTAGASDELSQRFAEAAPQLLEIAKASNKLNPSLGDTAFLYDSIATGIKRASPLILDNLGIVVKVGEANDKYAEALGKTTEELTAEEKQMALLNATLEAGGQLINQVGGNVESQTDAYARFRVEIEKQTDAFKRNLADGLTPVLGGWLMLQDAVGELTVENQDLFNNLGIVDQRLEDQAHRVEELTQVTDKYAAAQARASERFKEAAPAIQNMTVEVGGLNQNLQVTPVYMDKVAKQAEDSAIRAEELADASEELAKRQEEAAEAAADLAERLAEAKAATGDFFTSAVEAEDGTIDLKESLYDAADAAGAGAETLAILGVATGKFSEEQARAALKTVAMMQKVQELGGLIAQGMNIDVALARLADFQEELESTTFSLSDVKRGALDAQKAIDSIQGKTVDVITRFFNEGIPSGKTGRVDDDKASAKGQHGLDFTVPPGYNNDDFLIGVSSGERVNVQTAAQQITNMTFGDVIVGGSGQSGTMTAHNMMQEIGRQVRQANRSGSGILGRT